MKKSWGYLIQMISGEWVWAICKASNGGSIIAFRALFCSVILLSLILGIINLIDPTRIMEFSWFELRKQIVDKIPWFGVIFATIYVGLYTRYSSQWTYIANLHISIIQAQATNGSNEIAIAEWKAVFIKYAEDLHLADKPMFASLKNSWLNAPLVNDKYKMFTYSDQESASVKTVVT